MTPEPLTQDPSGGGQQQNQNLTQSQDSGREWVTTMVPEALRNEPWLKNVKDPADLISQHNELVKYQGRSIALPGKDAKPEEWEKVLSKLRPEKADAYDMAHPSWPKEVPYNEDFEKGAREQFHKLGLTPGQGKALYEWYIGQNLSAITTMGESQANRYDEGTNEDTKKLKADWGVNYDKEFQTAQRALSALIGHDKNHPVVKWLDSTGESKNPVLIRFFNEVGKSLGEDKIRGEESHMATEDEIKTLDKQINDIRADPKSAYRDENHPGHKAAVAEMLALYRKKTEALGTGAGQA